MDIWPLVAWTRGHIFVPCLFTVTGTIMQRILKYGESILEYSGVLAFGLLSFSIFLAVVDRFILQTSRLFWAEEFARLLFIWTCFLMAAVVVRRREHFRVSYFIDKLPGGERIKWFTNIVIDAMLIATISIVILYGVKLALFTWSQQSAALRIPMGFMYGSLPLAGLFMLFFWIVDIYETVVKILNSKSTNKMESSTTEKT
jgi:TRAP-type C4-dicarboxylate transport system permease small subunit